MRRAIPGCVALTTLVSACSVGLQDNLDDYLRARGVVSSSTADAGQQPMSASSDGATGCVPHFEPDGGGAENIPWQPPAPLHQNRCTDQQAQTLADCAVNDPQTLRPTCRDFFSAPANQACIECAITSDSAPTSGALLRDGSGEAPWPNVEGCVAAMSGDTSVSGCGPKMLALSICESIVCDDTQCKTEQEYYACANAADKTLCADRASASSCAAPYLPKCVSDRSFAEDALVLVRAFCGAPN